MDDIFIVILRLIHQRGHSFMSRSAFQVRLKLHLSLNTLVRLSCVFCPKWIDSRHDSSSLCVLPLPPSRNTIKPTLDSTHWLFYIFPYIFLISFCSAEGSFHWTCKAFRALPSLCCYFPCPVAKAASLPKVTHKQKLHLGSFGFICTGWEVKFFIKSRSHLHRMPEGVHCWKVHIWNWRCAATTHPAACLFSAVCGEARMVSMCNILNSC